MKDLRQDCRICLRRFNTLSVTNAGSADSRGLEDVSLPAPVDSVPDGSDPTLLTGDIPGDDAPDLPLGLPP